MEKIKPCPFCGGEAAIVHQARRKVYKSDEYVYGNCVYCQNCDAEIFSSINKAVDMWNRREGGQPERKKGKWIERNPQNSPDCRLIECSECGNAYIVGYNINYDDWIDGRNFCMKCGADLREGNNGKNT